MPQAVHSWVSGQGKERARDGAASCRRERLLKGEAGIIGRRLVTAWACCKGLEVPRWMGGGGA